MLDGMTNIKAREVLKELKDYTEDLPHYSPDEVAESIEMAINELEQPPCEDYIRELIREFDNKHPALFGDYMREFNNHPISEIIEYMWDMHCLIEDIKYRLPDGGGGEE